MYKAEGDQGRARNLSTMGTRLADELRGYRPEVPDLEFAVRHVPKHMRSALHHPDPWRRRNALGHLFQSAIYNKIHKICDQLPEVASFVRQFNDVPMECRSLGAAGQNGFFYTTEGQVVVRGDGYDLGEFDGLIFGNGDSLVFDEIITSKMGLDGLVGEVSYKRYLLKLLVSKEPDFLLITSRDIAGRPPVKELLRDPHNHLVKTEEPADLPRNLAEKVGLHEKYHLCTKPILISDIKNVNQFDYEKAHAPLREALLKSLQDPRGSGKDFGNDQLTKQIIVGSLDREAVLGLFARSTLYIDGRPLSEQDFDRRCSSIILVLRWPEGRPKLYLRARHESPRVGSNYLKLGPWSKTTFGFERNILKKRTAFFNLLDSTKTTVNRSQLTSILDRYLRDEVTGKREKFGEHPIW